MRLSKVAVISGITGQDGGYLSKLLLSKGYKVVGLVRELNAQHMFGLKFLQVYDQIEFREVNLKYFIQIKKIINEFKPDEFYNLAAQSSVGTSFQKPVDTFEFNTISTLNILEAIRQFSFRTKFYQASSSEMFGDIGKDNLPLKESMLFHPVSPYGISKASAHWLTINYREAYGLKTCCGILFNHESCLMRDYFVIKKIINTAIRIKRGELEKLELGNLTVNRDWGYAPKFVEAMWLMLQQENFDDYIICSGQVTSLKSIVERVFKKLDVDFKNHVTIDKSLLRNLDLDIIYGDNSRAKSELGWDYNISTDELIDKLINDEELLIEWQNQQI